MDKRRWFSLAIVGAVIIGGGTAFAFAAADDDEALTGSTYDRATEAALEETGGGTVIETEKGDGGAAYGVEVQLDGGNVVEVELDADFNVIGTEADDDSGEDDDD